MVTKRSKVRGYEYRVFGGSGKRNQKIVTARNVREAGRKAVRLFPKTNTITVSRKPSRKGKEYETYIIGR